MRKRRTTPKLRLGIDNPFAVKSWPEPGVWSAIIAEELDLQNVQFSFDLLDALTPELVRSTLFASIKDVVALNGLSINTCFCGLRAYIRNLLAHANLMVGWRGIRWY